MELLRLRAPLTVVVGFCGLAWLGVVLGGRETGDVGGERLKGDVGSSEWSLVFSRSSAFVGR